jgi:simple sugar transport system substrate-binding protein
MTIKRSRAALAVASAGVLAVTGALAGCTTQTEDVDAGIGDGISTIVVGGPLADPFFAAVEQGGADAAELLGASYEYTAPNDFSNGAADISRLIETAIGKDPDVLVVGDFIPPVEDELIAKAVDAGITVVVFNSGLGSWEAVGATTFVGEDPVASGTAAGEAEAEAGVTNGVCINHIPENPVLQVRCDAYIAALEAAGGTGTTLTIPSTESGDQQVVSQKIAGFLNSNPDVDGVLTLGANVAIAAQRGIADSGADAQLGTTDLSNAVLDEVKAGTILFAIDQQPYIQSYFAITVGIQQAVYGLHPISPILTSPLVITSDNVDKVLEVNETYGVRGAN